MWRFLGELYASGPTTSQVITSAGAGSAAANEATARIRGLELERGDEHTPIIGLSARAMDGDREIALAAGMNDYLAKPLREADLESALDRWVGAPVLLRQQ